MSHRLLVINPGSTSTKIAVYEDEKPLLEQTLRHSAEELRALPASSINTSIARISS